MESVETNPAQSLLTIRNLSVFTPGGRPLIRDFELDVAAGQVVLIKGGNGSGKTTLIRCLLDIWPDYTGAIKLSMGLKSVAYLPQIQTPEVHMPLSIKDLLKMSSPQADESQMVSFGLLKKEQLQYNWNSASGGEKKRALLTRIFLNHPKLIFLDEPFNHLDQASHSLIGTALRAFVENEGGTLVLVSHEDASKEFFDGLPIKMVQL